MVVVGFGANPSARKVLSTVLSPGHMGSLWLRNRVIMPPMVTNFAEEDGQVGESIIRHYAERARGGVGLVIVEASYVEPQGRGFPFNVGISSDEHLVGLERLTKAVRAEGARVGIQIFHAGGNTDLSDGVPGAPSAFHYRQEQPPSRELTIGEVEGLVDSFVAAGKRAKRAGFELVQVHMAHRYLIHQFLSPISNRRSDRYGVDRTRFAVEVVRGLRQELGTDYPIACRIGGADGRPDGLSGEDMHGIAIRLVEAGVQCIDVSPRGFSEWLPAQEGCAAGWSYLAEGMKRIVDVPVVTVGGIVDLHTADSVIVNGQADFVGIGRQLLADPYLVRKSAEGRADEVRHCDGCRGCERSMRHRGIRCPSNPKLGRG